MTRTEATREKAVGKAVAVETILMKMKVAKVVKAVKVAKAAAVETAMTTQIEKKVAKVAKGVAVETVVTMQRISNIVDI